MEQFIRLIICVIVLFAVSVMGKFATCNTPEPKVTKVLCNTKDMEKEECILKKGQNASLEVTFEAESSSKSLKSVCHGLIAGVPIPFNDIDKVGCDGMYPKCPLVAGTTYTFSTKIFVKTVYPSMRLAIKWEEVDVATGKDIWCLVIPAQIQ